MVGVVGVAPWEEEVTPAGVRSGRSEEATMHRRQQRRAPWRAAAPILALLLLGAVLTACGDGGDGQEQARAAEDGVLRLVGQDDLRWDVERLTAPAGAVTFELTCEDAVNHNVVIDELDEEVAVCAPGETGTGSIELQPGSYTYVCTVPGHESSMRGELVVE